MLLKLSEQLLDWPRIIDTSTVFGFVNVFIALQSFRLESVSPYLDDLLSTDTYYFQQMEDKMYAKEQTQLALILKPCFLT